MPEATPGMNTRFAIHSMSSPSAAMREGSSDIAARTPKSCIISPPPIQMIAIDTWTKSRNEYQVTRPSLGSGLHDHHEDDREQHEDQIRARRTSRPTSAPSSGLGPSVAMRMPTRLIARVM